jgi:translation initiation factor 1 (eIF-1/SUI1)
MCTIFVHPVIKKAEKKEEERKHPRALSRINNKEVERKIRIAAKTRKREGKKMVIIHPK